MVTMEETSTRINKYISQCGYCSRREADRLIENKRVYINGKLATMGTKVNKNDSVTIDNQQITPCLKEYVLAFHKPAGIVCTTSKVDKNNVIDYLNFPERIYPVGRLDKESTGLLLLTNNGQLMDDILRGSNYHEKEYIVHVNKPITNSVLDAMRQGVPILNTMTRPCKIKRMGKDCFYIILTQGLNRQIRRMCEYFDYRVTSLKRIRIMNIDLGTLGVGQWRELSSSELMTLKNLAQNKGDSK